MRWIGIREASEVEVKLPLQESKAGAITLLVTQHGLTEPQPVSLRAFAEAGRYDASPCTPAKVRHAKGSRLDEVRA